MIIQVVYTYANGRVFVDDSNDFSEYSDSLPIELSETIMAAINKGATVEIKLIKE